MFRGLTPRAVSHMSGSQATRAANPALQSRAPMQTRCDYLVIGSGVAGLSFALEAAEHGDVVVVSKRALDDAATAYAQGGIAAVLDPTDSFEGHVQDTLEAGRGLSHTD